MNEKIKNLRHQTKLTQAEFAKKLGVSRAVIAQIETNKNNPTAELLQKIYKEFNIDLLSDNVSENHILQNKKNSDSEEIYLSKNDIRLKINDLRILYDDNMKFLYFICTILKSKNYKFSKDEKTELHEFAGIGRFIQQIVSGEVKITLENFETLILIIKVSLFRFNGRMMHKAEGLLDIDVTYSMDEILS